jgi:hypothetical protein
VSGQKLFALNVQRPLIPGWSFEETNAQGECIEDNQEQEAQYKPIGKTEPIVWHEEAALCFFTFGFEAVQKPKLN